MLRTKDKKDVSEASLCDATEEGECQCPCKRSFALLLLWAGQKSILRYTTESMTIQNQKRVQKKRVEVLKGPTCSPALPPAVWSGEF